MEHTVFGAEIGGYIGNMPQKSQKKSEQILIMVVPETFAEVKMIAKREDRPLGYVARELMHRGLGPRWRIDSTHIRMANKASTTNHNFFNKLLTKRAVAVPVMVHPAGRTRDIL